jgi:hypothetical protein
VKPVSEDQTIQEVRPLWDGWSQPQNAAEALDIGLSYAEMEGLWCQAALFEVRTNEHGYHIPHSKNYVKGDEPHKCMCDKCVAKRTFKDRLETQGLTCGDIKACSVGIAIMAVMDGPAVARYFKNPYDAKLQGELIRDPVGAATLVYLHAGMKRVAMESKMAGFGEAPDDSADKYVRETILLPFKTTPKRCKVGGPKHRAQQRELAEYAAEEVIDFNDYSEPIHAVGAKPKPPANHHDKIIAGFRYARDYAREDYPLEPQPIAVSPAAA